MKHIKQLSFTEFELDIRINPEDKKDLSECGLFFEGEGQRIIDLNRSSEFISTIPKGKYTLYKTGGTHRLDKFSDRKDFPFIVNNLTNKIVVIRYSKGAYPVIDLYKNLKEGNTPTNRKTISIHRLVAMAFIENPRVDTLNLVDHINEDKHDYCVSNLRWTNNSMNMKDVKNTAKNNKHKTKVWVSSYE